MATKELLFVEEDGTLGFGDYTLTSKTKLDNFEFAGDIYKVKTFAEITKLEKNGMFVYESVPGSAVACFTESAKGVSFEVSAAGDVQLTVGLEPECEYKVWMNEASVGTMRTNLSGKLSVSAELSPNERVAVKIEKCE